MTGILDAAHGFALGALVFAALGMATECTAAADRVTPQLALGATCAGETAWTNHDECTAIGLVLARRSRSGEITPWIARAYSAAYRSARRAWVVELNADGRRPRSFPRHLDWDGKWGPEWRELYEHAGRIVRGEVASPCSETPDHFGARYGVDFERAVRARWSRVDCGPTRNAFWRTR